MKIKIYILTYNNNFVLNDWCLKTLFQSNIDNYNHEINIINNHSNIKIDQDYIPKVNVINNLLRPDFSCGHISKDWNAAIVNGFKDLNNPDCDILVCIQNDEKFKKNWVENIINYHKIYDFIQFGSGDAFLSFNVNAIKKIGLFDERFLCGKQEQDYFIRAFLFNKVKSSINDHTHGYLLNRLENNITDITLDGNDINREPQAEIVRKTYEKYQKPSRIFFKIKWGCEHPSFQTAKLSTYNIMLYPYFEKNIETLLKQKYIL